jgi:HAD superfamily hydrolase (TIGR01549 family)
VAKKFYNIDLKDEKLFEHWGKPLNTLVSELYENSDTLENMIKAYSSTREDFRKVVYEGSVEAVTRLLDNGVKVGVLSAANREFVVDDLDRLKFPTERFTVIQGPEDTAVHKPDPDVFLPLLETFKKEGIKQKDMVYVGDSVIDLQAAHGAGLDFIAVTTGLYREEDFKKLGAKIIIRNITELTKKVL